MSFYDKKREREFQIELLKVQLKYERENNFFSALMGVGVSLLVFAIAFNFSVLSFPGFPTELKEVITNSMYAFFGVGLSLIIFSPIVLWVRGKSEKKELQAIQKKFAKNEW